MNIDWNAIKSWLITDAGAGWIIGAIGVFLTTVSLVKKNSANIVVCKEIDKFTLIKINKKVKENTLIKYKNSEIKNLAQVDLELYNNGGETIKDLKISILFPTATKILDVIMNKTPDVVGKRKIKDNIIDMSLSYLNAYEEHKSKVLMSIVCDGDISKIKVTGGGEGWSLVHKKMLSKKQTRNRLIILIILLSIEVSLYSILTWKSIQFSIVNVLFYSLFFLTYIGGFLWALRTNTKMILEIYSPLLSLF